MGGDDAGAIVVDPIRRFVRVMLNEAQLILHPPAPAENRLSIGFGGDLPVLPPVAIFGGIGVAFGLHLSRRAPFLPGPLSTLPFRVAVFAASLAGAIHTIGLADVEM